METGPLSICSMCVSEMIQKFAAKLQHSCTYYARPLAVLRSLSYAEGPQGYQEAIAIYLQSCIHIECGYSIVNLFQSPVAL